MENERDKQRLKFFPPFSMCEFVCFSDFNVNIKKLVAIPDFRSILGFFRLNFYCFFVE